jgi:hypothetical protein
MSDKPPPFAGYTPVSGDELWAKILSGEIEAHIYSSEALGDFEPVPISAAEFVLADQAGCDQEYGFSTGLKPFQILWRDVDRRRSDRARRSVRVPHWVYLAQKASQAPAPAASSTARRGRPPLDWQTIQKVAFELMDHHGEFSPDDSSWNAQARLEATLQDRFGAGITTLREHLPDILAAWRKTKVGN